MSGRRIVLAVALVVTAVGVTAAAAYGRRAQEQTVTVGAPASAIDAVPAADSEAAAIPNAGPAAQASDVQARAGKVVARGTGFYIEEVPLDSPATVTISGASVTATSVLRITITAGPFVVRDAAAVVAVDGRPLGIGQESADLSKLSTSTFDRSVLTNGARLSYAYGLPGHVNTAWSSTVEVVR